MRGGGVNRDHLSLCSGTKLKVCSDRRPRILYYQFFYICASDHEDPPMGDSHQIMSCFVQTIEIIIRFPAPDWIKVKVDYLNVRNSRKSKDDKGVPGNLGKGRSDSLGQSRYGLSYVDQLVRQDVLKDVSNVDVDFVRELRIPVWPSIFWWHLPNQVNLFLMKRFQTPSLKLQRSLVLGPLTLEGKVGRQVLPGEKWRSMRP